jgi:hypothetical protein
MLGWMSIFALMFSGGAIALVDSVHTARGMTSCLVFGFLLALSALTLMLRGGPDRP